MLTQLKRAVTHLQTDPVGIDPALLATPDMLPKVLPTVLPRTGAAAAAVPVVPCGDSWQRRTCCQ